MVFPILQPHISTVANQYPYLRTGIAHLDKFLYALLAELLSFLLFPPGEFYLLTIHIAILASNSLKISNVSHLQYTIASA
jgi:hypothetical protein